MEFDIFLSDKGYIRIVEGSASRPRGYIFKNFEVIFFPSGVWHIRWNGRWEDNMQGKGFASFKRCYSKNIGVVVKN